MPMYHGFTDNDKALILTGNFDTHLWLRIHRFNGATWSFIDVESSAIGYDPTISAQLSYDIDSPAGSATIILQLFENGESISPLNFDSPVNTGSDELFRPGKRIELYACVVPKGNAIPAKTLSPVGYPTIPDYTWHRMFGGRIDNVSMSGDDLTLSCRSYEWLLLDRFIEDVTKYGGGDPVETVMQNIVTQWLTADPMPGGTPAFYSTVVTPTSPLWNINDYAQQAQPIMEALRVLAQQIGWDIRYFETDGLADPELTFYDPDRVSYTPGALYGYDIAMDFYYEFAPIEINGDDIRNVIEGRLASDKTIYTVSDAASIAKYGRRFMRIVEDANSNIDTAGEMNDMLDIILSDLREPRATATVRCPFYPVRLNSILRVNGDGLGYAELSIQGFEFSITGYQHNFSNGECETTIQLRADAPVSGSRWWTQQEGEATQFVETVAPTIGITAPEGTLWIQCSDLSFPP
jgi:hypothetical protein